MKKIYCGIDRAESLPLLNEGRLGLITNHSGVTKDLTPGYEYLNENYWLTALFSPEHGIYGAAQAGAKIEGAVIEEKTGIPVYSLYGEKTAPDGQMLSDVDILCFDMQDVGARFYTYLYTMTRSMKVAAGLKKPFVVFDRINPVGLTVAEGEILDERNASFIGEYAVPHRYGLTIGEFAKYINEEKGIGAELYIVKCEGLDRDTYFDETDLCFVAPSPNMPTASTALVYTGTCIFEGVRNVSEGRGTTQPFEFIGAPFIDEFDLADYMNGLGLPGVKARKVRFTPTFSKFSGETCRGIQIHVTDKRAFSPFEYGCFLFGYLNSRYELDINVGTVTRNFGTDRILTVRDTEALVRDCRTLSARFKKSTDKYKIYG